MALKKNFSRCRPKLSGQMNGELQHACCKLRCTCSEERFGWARMCMWHDSLHFPWGKGDRDTDTLGRPREGRNGPNFALAHSCKRQPAMPSSAQHAKSFAILALELQIPLRPPSAGPSSVACPARAWWSSFKHASFLFSDSSRWTSATRFTEDGGPGVLFANVLCI